MYKAMKEFKQSQTSLFRAQLVKEIRSFSVKGASWSSDAEYFCAAL